jgi:AraC-like DNA-binding protein
MPAPAPLTSETFAGLCHARTLMRSPRHVRIRQAAAAARLSPFQFIRRFKALFGETPHQLRVAARIDRAQRLLALTDRPVTDVCLDVGFSSLGSFSALFSRRVGQSPSAYRAEVRATTSPAERPRVLYPGCLTLMGAAFATLEKRADDAPRDTAACESS